MKANFLQKTKGITKEQEEPLIDKILDNKAKEMHFMTSKRKFIKEVPTKVMKLTTKED